MLVSRRSVLFLAIALVCFGGTLALSVLAPRLQIPDRVSFAVTTGYVVFMLLFIFSVRSTEPAPGDAPGDSPDST